MSAFSYHEDLKEDLLSKLYPNFLLIDSRSNLDPTFLDKVPIFSYLFKILLTANNRIKTMMKLAIIFLPILFAVIWANDFIG